MQTTSQNGFPPHKALPADIGDTLCEMMGTAGAAYYNNVVFENFKTSYSGFSACGNNTVFVTDPNAFDSVCAHYLTASPCTNCDNSALFYFKYPDPKTLGWFGGCGSFECTGLLNALLTDLDGSFFGAPG
jgi:hypothetical protein